MLAQLEIADNGDGTVRIFGTLADGRKVSYNAPAFMYDTLMALADKEGALTDGD